MVRIAGADLPPGKRVEVALTKIYGIGLSHSQETLVATKVDKDKRVRELSEEEVVRLRSYLDKNFKVEGDLRRGVSQDIKRLMEIGCYRGIRHRKGLPVRGQRTHTNARTRKGPRKTVGVERKK